MANMAKSSLPTVMVSPGYASAAYDPFTPIDAVSPSPLSTYYSTWDMRYSTPSRDKPNPEPEPLHGLVTRLMAACTGYTAAAIPVSSPSSSSSADEDDDYIRPTSRGRTRRSEDVGMGKDWGRQSVLSVNEIPGDAGSPTDQDGTLYQVLESRQSARKDMFLAAMSCRELGIIHEDAREE